MSSTSLVVVTRDEAGNITKFVDESGKTLSLANIIADIGSPKGTVLPGAPEVFRVNEGSVLSIEASVTGAGKYEQVDIKTGQTIGAVVSVGNKAKLTTAAKKGTVYYLVTTTAGSIDAVVGDAVLAAVKFSQTAINALVDAAGDKIPLAEAYSSASKGFPMIYAKTRKVLNTSTPGFSATATGGSETYFDFNRGADANPGTRALPKKTLAGVNSTAYGAGAIILLASDSTWDLVGTTSVVNQINCDQIAGSAGSPVLITAYDAAGHTGLKPTITHSYKPAANEWTYDATVSAWYFTVTNALYPGPGACCFLGPNKIGGINVWQDGSGHIVSDLPPMFADFQFSYLTDNSTYKKFYVWAPAGTNPTAYYGGVMLSFAGRGALFTGSNGLRNTIIDGLKFAYTGFGVAINPTVVGTAHTGLIVRNCETDHAGLLEYYYSAAGNANSFVAYSNKGVETPTAFIKIGGNSSATTDYDIYQNEVRGANRQFSAMGAIYSQAVSTALGAGKVHHNYLYDCQNGTGTEFNGMPGSTSKPMKYGCPFDGTAVYFDLSSNRGVAYGNIIERCHVAMQTNSAKQAQLIGNIAIDCNVLATCTDAGSVGSNDVLVMHNTYINRLPNQAQLKHGTASKPDFAFTNWYENAASSSIRIINNAFYRAAVDGTREAIRIERDAGTKLVVGNALSGWSNAVKVIERRLIGPETTDITATALDVRTDGADWFEGTTAVPLKDGSLTKAGRRHIDGLTDMTGTAFERIPTIGALEWTPS